MYLQISTKQQNKGWFRRHDQEAGATNTKNWFLKRRPRHFARTKKSTNGGSAISKMTAGWYFCILLPGNASN
jgi:hypothetical protein